VFEAIRTFNGVARSAVEAGVTFGKRLEAVLRKIDAAGARVPAELLDARSAGIKDLRHGYILDEEWAGKDPDEVFANARRNVPLLDRVGYYFVAATITRDPAHPVAQLLGDLLVRLPSATGAAGPTHLGKRFPRTSRILP